MSASVPFNPSGTPGSFTAPKFTLDDPVLVVSAGAIGSVVALIAAFYFVRAVLSEEEGNPRMRALRRLIYEGALRRRRGRRRLRRRLPARWGNAWRVACPPLLYLLLFGAPPSPSLHVHPLARPPPPSIHLPGARAYLLTQYKWLSLWVGVMFILLTVRRFFAAARPSPRSLARFSPARPPPPCALLSAPPPPPPPPPPPRSC